MFEGILFSRFLKGLILVPIFKNVGERSTAKIYCSVSLLSEVSKIFEKLTNNRLVDHFKNKVFFLFFIMVSGLFDQLQIL